MKQLRLLCLACCAMIFFACGNSNSSSNTRDTTGDRTLPPPSTNSDATNPSLADTAYHSKDTMVTHGDSIRAGKK